LAYTISANIEPSPDFWYFSARVGEKFAELVARFILFICGIYLQRICQYALSA
jgi:hypothetical protein